MVDRIYITSGKIDGSSYLILSTDKPPIVSGLRYRQPDKMIDKMFRKRKTCTVPFGSFIQSPWTDWLKEKDKSS